jgi:PPOX class probable F420-dependent enzyme
MGRRSAVRARTKPTPAQVAKTYTTCRAKPSVVPGHVTLTFILDLPREAAARLSARAIEGRSGQKLSSGGNALNDKEELMSTSLSADAKALIDRPNFAHLATLMADGSPHSVPVWVGREGDRLLVCTSEGSLKGRNTSRDPRVALSILDLHNPYEEVQLRGRVVERRPDPELKIMDPISHKYVGQPFPMRSPAGRVALVIELDKVRYTKLPFTHTPPRS